MLPRYFVLIRFTPRYAALLYFFGASDIFSPADIAMPRARLRMPRCRRHVMPERRRRATLYAMPFTL